MGKVLCLVTFHRWRRQQAKDVGGAATFYRCTRCGKERFDGSTMKWI